MYSENQSRRQMDRADSIATPSSQGLSGGHVLQGAASSPNSVLDQMVNALKKTNALETVAGQLRRQSQCASACASNHS